MDTDEILARFPSRAVSLDEVLTSTVTVPSQDESDDFPPADPEAERRAIRAVQRMEAKHLVQVFSVTADSGEQTDITLTMLRDGLHICSSEENHDHFISWEEMSVNLEMVQHLPEPASE